MGKKSRKAKKVSKTRKKKVADLCEVTTKKERCKGSIKSLIQSVGAYPRKKRSKGKRRTTGYHERAPSGESSGFGLSGNHMSESGGYIN